MNLLQLQQGSKAYGSKVLFDQASFSINAGEHVGVIGPNGAGKTTLFKVLIGEELDSGQVIRSRELRLGYLSQHDDFDPSLTVESYISDQALMPLWELKPMGLGLGLDEEIYSKKVRELSGGYRMRVKLLKMLAQKPNLMLLDEPTNYLDLETLLVLEKFLQGFDGAFLLISHDREFLRRTTDHIVEVEAGSITKFSGGLDDYFEQKELLRSQLEARALSVEQKRQEVLDFVARFGAKATKASQAQSRLKSLERLESIELKALPTRARIRIPAPAKTGRRVLSFEKVELGYSAQPILRGVSLQLMAGDHLAVVGLNGAGKSTVLKALAGRLEPRAGTIELGHEVTLAFFAQHVAEELHPDHSVFRSLQLKAHPEVKPQEILDLAGSLLFSGDDVQKPIRVLSGGERSRVALGQVLLQKASCLVLDEPTNHLDFDTVEALTEALKSFPGSVVVVSHDRSFIGRVGTRILEVSAGSVSLYPGTYDEYVWSLERGAYATLKGQSRESQLSGASERSQSDSAPSRSAAYKEERKQIDRRLKQLEGLIRELEARVPKLESGIAALNSEIASMDLKHSAEKIHEITQLQNELSHSENQWLAALEERESLQVRLTQLIQQ
jgi:ATP-binding cassette subfamily F protein 3